METILAGILMLVPAIFFFLLIAGGIIMVSMWIYAHLPINKTWKKYRLERRSGIDRRHTAF
ncbi:MAG: hypothetical protein KZQ78_18640 [Candidatus Thiodiazotropha sp. (ex Ustalcina ferruginea)]|nr:hypothetical protein [Candidatus Thiodiazotropha sp. (ex Ustalcina ferruginea)]